VEQPDVELGRRGTDGSKAERRPRYDGPLVHIDEPNTPSSTRPVSPAPPGILLREHRTPRSTIVLSIILGIFYALLLALPLPPPVSLSAPISQITPFPIACVLPPKATHASLDDLVYLSRTIGAQARLIVWPESALILNGGTDERREAVVRVWLEVCVQYGVWVAMGVDSYYEATGDGRGGRRRNEVILVGPKGLIGKYAKQRLVPCEWYTADFTL
jgi:apolipoprotein N-acyltransferase